MTDTTPTLYGIKACDTMRKARLWLAEHGVDVVFHDYKTQGITAARLESWVAQVGWEKLLNRAGTTFRKLSDSDKDTIDQAKAIALMVQHPSLIKRPVLVYAGGICVGFKPDIYAALPLQG